MTNDTRRVLRRGALVAAALLLTLAVAAPAGAAPPQKNDLEFSGTFACDGFSYTLELQGRGLVWPLRRDRLRTREVWHGSAASTTGVTVRLHHSFTGVVDLRAGTLTLTGLGFGAWVEGRSFRRVFRGRVVLDLVSGEPIFLAGRHPEVFDPHAFTCELIAEAQA